MRGGAHLRAWTSSVSLQAAMTNLLFAANRQRAGRPTKKLPIQPPKAKKTRRVVRVADMIARHQKQLNHTTE